MHIPTYTYQLEAISQNIVILDSCNRQLASSERPHLKCPITITFVISTILSIKTNRYFTKKIMPQPLYLLVCTTNLHFDFNSIDVQSQLQFPRTSFMHLQLHFVNCKPNSVHTGRDQILFQQRHALFYCCICCVPCDLTTLMHT